MKQLKYYYNPVRLRCTFSQDDNNVLRDMLLDFPKTIFVNKISNKRLFKTFYN